MSRRDYHVEPGEKVQEAYQADLRTWGDAMSALPKHLRVPLTLAQVWDNPVIAHALDVHIREARRRLGTEAVGGRVEITTLGGGVVFTIWQTVHDNFDV